MNRFLPLVLYLSISIFLIIIQTSILTPKYIGIFSPDLNLILIIYLAINPKIKNSFALVVFNGFLMDFFSGNTPGLYTFTRIIAYIMLRYSITKFDFNSRRSQAVAIFAATLLFWCLIFIVLKIKSIESFSISLNLVLHQATINTAVGTILIILFRKLDAKFQK
ncbi:MAG: rod shape-determining protein MreD [Thermodesulfobacteriota bacterium]